ncbi:HGxxPAAW family protein [Promicromonospora sp. NPDC019610]|uniref:HGxxPAAW family protein n=1 Tax=Promicromonospora sp. NPDC019610 TaxID=3364405 RepID=UPI0037AFD954
MTENKPEIAYLPPGVPPTNHGHTVAAWVTMVGITLGVLISSWGVVVAQSWSAWLVLFVLGFVVVGASLVIGLVLRNLGLGQKTVQR